MNSAIRDLRQFVRRAVNLTEGKARQSGVALVAHLADEPVSFGQFASLEKQTGPSLTAGPVWRKLLD